MAQTGDRREEVIEQLADFVLAHGLDAANLRAMARACGTSDRMLLYYFTDKAAMMTAVLQRIALRMTAMLDAAAPPHPLPAEALRAAIVPLLLDDAVWPYMRVWLSMASRAAHGDVLCRSLGEALGRGFLSWAASHIANADEGADEGADGNARATDAARLLAAVEGLVLLKALGLDDVVARAG